MKASEVLTKYRRGEKDFRGANLRGQSFEGKDLSGANFSEADLRSANFAEATLIGTNFTGAKCGVSKSRAVFFKIPFFLLFGILIYPYFAFLFITFIYSLYVPVLPIVVPALIAEKIADVIVGGKTAQEVGVVVGAIVGLLIELYFIQRVQKKRGIGASLTAIRRSINVALVAIGAIGGTSFRGADLTRANFSSAKLESTDIREAILTHVCWYGAKRLDRVRPGATYLKNEPLRQLLINGEGQNQNFDRQNLRGVYLQRANLVNASFINSNLSETNLQGAILLGANLVQTNLDKTNLRDAVLTGACLENWRITRNTVFDGIRGDYVYLKLPTKYDRDPNRIPPLHQGNFDENEFYTFIASILDTLNLYHRQNINAGVALAVLKGLSEDYPVQFELAGIEKRGDSQYVMKLKVVGQSDHLQLQQEYYARYEQTFPLYDPKMLMPDTENMVAEIINTVKKNPGTHIENLHNKGIVITGGKVDMSGKRIEQSGNFGVGVNKGKIRTEKLAGTLNEAEQKNLADAATEIQQLLEQLSETYPTTTSREKNIVVGEVVDRIESNPTLKARVINALKTGGTEAFKEAVDHPLINILVATIEGLLDAE